MSNVNTYPIQTFIEQVKLADMSQQKSIMLDIRTAKMLAFTLGEVTAKLNQDYEEIIKQLQTNSNQTLEIRMDGGSFK